MRLGHLSEKARLAEEATKKVKNAPTDEDRRILEGLLHEMHKTMLDADRLIRRIELILDKS